MKSLGNWFVKLIQTFFLFGQVIFHVLIERRLHWRNSVEQMSVVGTESLIITLITASFVGGVFTIQVAKEFINFGAQQAIGGVLAIALTRELAPTLTAVVIAGRVGSAFAAEIGTMQVTEQIDALYMLRTNPIDYLVTPRIVACVLMMPVLTILSLITGMTGGLFISEALYGIPQSVFLDSVQTFLKTWDVITAIVKAGVFGVLIATIGTNWGLTTTGGAKGVGESTTTAVVTALLAIFASNFFMSWILYSDALSSVAGAVN
ncbi:MlaE family lipid ABC transporter permease subunit [Pseudanabaena sp. PCC 6802]|uniref:MlaE family lipid ABC transporter permease subunit n=1 Tax=Pseudanabaena sp. PCC 6802 TaxID=118173 RepID=UPI00034648D1|nr:MlaE family lipid ABC transporter permease subunit [Pseudanabaena sp. PCC 6802]